MEKRPLNVKTLILKTVFVAVLLILSGWAISQSVTELTHYNQAVLRTVTIPAQVCKVVTSEDSEGDLSYDVYVAYEFEGQVYSTKYDRTSDDEWAGSHGRVLEVQIDSANPEQLLKTPLEQGVSHAILGAVILAVALMLFSISARKERTDCVGLTDDEIRSDLMGELLRRTGWLALAVVSAAVITLRMLYPTAMPTFVLVIAVALGVAGFVLLVNNLRRIVMVKQERYQVRREHLVDKEINDTDDGKIYYLHYSDGDTKWKCTTTQKKYDAAVLGQSVKSVYLHGEKKPLIHYPLSAKQ